MPYDEEKLKQYYNETVGNFATHLTWDELSEETKNYWRECWKCRMEVA